MRRTQFNLVQIVRQFHMSRHASNDRCIECKNSPRHNVWCELFFSLATTKSSNLRWHTHTPHDDQLTRWRVTQMHCEIICADLILNCMRFNWYILIERRQLIKWFFVSALTSFNDWLMQSIESVKFAEITGNQSPESLPFGMLSHERVTNIHSYDSPLTNDIKT